MNEFCDLESKTLRRAKKLEQNDSKGEASTYSLNLASKYSKSSARVKTQLQRTQPSLSQISFGFGMQDSNNKQQQTEVIKKQLNCSINVVAPKLHGLLVTINSIDLPKNLTKLSVTFYQNATHAQTVAIDSGNTNEHYLLTPPGNSKIGINLQSFQPIDWSTLGFDILFTVYKNKGNSSGCPNSNWFDCGENICVPMSLVCDNNKNCPNGNDEMLSYRCYSPLFQSIAVSTLLAVLLILAVVCFIYIYGYKRRDRGSNGNDSDDDDQYYYNADVLSESDEFEYGVDSDGLVLPSSKKIDLNLDTAKLTNGYLSNNLYAGGFENPIWTSGAANNFKHKRHTTSKSIR